MLKKKISLSVAIIMTVAGIAITGLLLTLLDPKPNTDAAETASYTNTTAANCSNINLVRLGGYAYTRPLLFGENNCESQKLLPVKNAVQALISSYKVSGVISSAAVYLKQLSAGDWMSIDESEKFNPGSLLKVPELITFMKMNEKKPGLLDTKVLYAQPLNLPKHAVYTSRSIEPGKSYSIRELLYYMIAYSDNNATMLLNQRMDLDLFKKLFTDLGLPEPDLTKDDIPVSAKDYSLFMRVLYNASYLNIIDSEYCTELLSHSDFSKGLLNGLPANIKVAHKFGEANDGYNAHFSETGIVYNNNTAYLLTVMTKGKETTVLPGVISEISKKVFEFLGHS